MAKLFEFELTKKVCQHSKIMNDIYFGANCNKTGDKIYVGDIVRFENNDTYSWQEFLVCFSQNTNKFYLLPYNFEHAPISLITRYMACDQKLYYNNIILVVRTDFFREERD